MNRKLHVVALIPARYEASRFPGKLLKDLGGKPVLLRTYEAVVASELFDEVYVVTDDDRIEQCIAEAGGRVLRSQEEHETGSDRLAEAIAHIQTDIAINVQGDEPFIDKDSLQQLIELFEADQDQSIDLASLMVRITEEERVENPNVVKVITDREGFALYFSRSPVPYPRDTSRPATYFQHIGVYAFRRQALLDFKALPIAPLEASEKIEAIRFLEYGRRLRMLETTKPSIGIDTPEDLELANQKWNNTQS